MFVDSPFSMLWVPHLPALREACGWAGQFEISVRLTTEALFGTGATSKDLDRMFAGVIEELRPYLSTEQVEALTSTNLCQLRNDLLHGRFSQAYGKLGGKTNDPAVASVFELPGSGPILPAIERAVSGEARRVPETKTADAGIVVWVAQAGQRGTFAQAAKAFEAACVAMHSALRDRGRAILKRATEQQGEAK